MANGVSGQWGTITFQVPDVLEGIRQTLNNVAEFLVSILDIALTILQLAKAFLVGFLDPILALVQAIIDEILALLQDLRQMGIYITGDWKLVGSPYDDLKGGFQDYERRMIARLTDRTDPTRPDVSAQSDIFSLFLYLSVDYSDIERLIGFITAILGFFNQQDNTPSSKPIPFITEVRYGSSTASIFQPQSLPEYFQLTVTPPNIAQVRWKVAPTAQRSQFNPFPDFPPGGFIVSVSTLPEGIQVMYDRPQRDTDTQPSVQDSDVQVQPHDYGVVRLENGKPLILYEGADFLENPGVLAYDKSLDGSGNVKPNKPRVYGVRSVTDNGVIPLEQLKSGDTYFLQRYFYVPLSSVATQWITGEYQLNLRLEDMPRAATVVVGTDGTMTIVDDGTPAALYVRVASTSSALALEERFFEYGFTQAKKFLDAGKKPFKMSLFDKTVNITDIGKYSNSHVVTFPNANTAEYLKAVRAALVVLVLARPDLILLDEIRRSLTPEALALVLKDQLILPGVALQASYLEGLRHLLGFVYDDYAKELQKRGETPLNFRKDLLERIDKAVHDFYSHTGPMPDVEAAVVQQTEFLRGITWGGIMGIAHPESMAFIPEDLQEATLLDSLNVEGGPGKEMQAGVALNPFCMDINQNVMSELFGVKGLIRDRKPHMMEAPINKDDPTFRVVNTATPEEAEELLKTAAPGLRIFYEKYREEDGSISVPLKAQPLLNTYNDSNRMEGSADDSPVFYVGKDTLVQMGSNITEATAGANAGVFYCRSLLANVLDGQLYQEAAVALGVASSAFQRTPADGEWIAVRFLDQFPFLEDALQVLINWLEAIKNSIDSIVDTIRKYIEFAEARVIELQQLMVRINALIQSLLGYSFRIPKSSALFLQSQGTDGVLADLVSADNKPSDSPLAYGAGVAIVIPLPLGAAPSALRALGLLQAFMVKEAGTQDLDATLSSGETIPDAIGLEALPGPPPVPPADEGPDVL